jgi:hypothetical protein
LCKTFPFRPARKYSLRPVFLRRPGPEAQQPTSRPPFRPAIASHLGRFPACWRPAMESRPFPQIGIRWSTVSFVDTTPPVSGCSPGNPRPFHLSPPPRLTNTCLTGGGFGLARGRRWPVTVKGGGARHAAAACSSLPPFSLGPPFLPFPPQHARSRVRPPMAAVERCGRRPAGDGEDEPRRP